MALNYEINANTKECTVIGLGNFMGSVLNLPSEIDGYKVTHIQCGAFAGCTSLVEVIIPGSIKEIYDNAFAGCTGLVSVTIGNGVKRIGNYAFAGCTSLAEVTIGNDVTSIGEYAFTDCTALVGVIIPESIKCIEEGAFSDCTALENINIPDNVEYIENKAFDGCSSLKNVIIHNSAAIIGGRAFRGCAALKGVTIGAIRVEGVTYTYPEYEERFANNGGSYYQPDFGAVVEGAEIVLKDSSCGDFGTRYTLVIDGHWVAHFGSMLDDCECSNNLKASDIPLVEAAAAVWTAKYELPYSRCWSRWLRETCVEA